MIDHENSTQEVESWKGHKTTLKCAVRKPAFDVNSIVRFFWEQGDRTSPIGKQVDWKTLSQMTLVTETDDEFDPVTCVAKTNSVTQRLDIKIKRLCKYTFIFYLLVFIGSNPSEIFCVSSL